MRLAALEESPEAFVATLEQEKGYDEQFWRERMRRSQRLIAEVDGKAVGVASVGQASGGNSDVAELFGLWVAPDSRGAGVATRLVQAGADVVSVAPEDRPLEDVYFALVGQSAGEEPSQP